MGYRKGEDQHDYRCIAAETFIRNPLPVTGIAFLCATAAMGFLRLRRPLVIAMTVAIAMLNLVEDYSCYRAPSFEDWHGVVDFVAQHAQPGDRLLIFPANYVEAIDYYVSRLDHPETLPIKVLREQVVNELKFSGSTSLSARTIVEVETSASFMSDSQRLWPQPARFLTRDSQSQ
jgi:hypothetical protein